MPESDSYEGSSTYKTVLRAFKNAVTVVMTQKNKVTPLEQLAKLLLEMHVQDAMNTLRSMYSYPECPVKAGMGEKKCFEVLESLPVGQVYISCEPDRQKLDTVLGKIAHLDGLHFAMFNVHPYISLVWRTDGDPNMLPPKHR